VNSDLLSSGTAKENSNEESGTTAIPSHEGKGRHDDNRYTAAAGEGSSVTLFLFKAFGNLRLPES
jgi:hypothetical protein